MINIFGRGNFNKTKNFLDRILNREMYNSLDRFGKLGVEALSRATPVDTGLTAASWDYRIISDDTQPGIEWYNTNDANGVSVAVLIQYGHATGTGGWVHGIDYINPAIVPLFDQIAEEVWKEVIR